MNSQKSGKGRTQAACDTQGHGRGGRRWTVDVLPLALPVWILLNCSTGKGSSRNSTAKITCPSSVSADSILQSSGFAGNDVHRKRCKGTSAKKARTEIPGLSWQVEWLWNGGTSGVCSRESPHGELELTFAWEGENCAQERSGTFSTAQCLPPPGFPSRFLLWQTNPLLMFRITESPTPFRRRGLLPRGRKPSLFQQHSVPEQPWSHAWLQFILGPPCHSRGNQCSFVRQSWQQIRPLKLVAFLERHKWTAGLTTPSPV